MSKFTTSLATSHKLSLAAMEEASRVGQRTADIDHLFLALVMSEEVAGQVLRSLGITLDSARDAVATQHAEQLASLGIKTPTPGPGKITFHETGGYDWSERALDVIRHSSEGGRRGDAAAVLRDLLTEPSGLVDAMLARLGTTPEAITVRLDEAERYSTSSARPTVVSDRLSGTSDAFVPASENLVWELLADAARMPEWEPSIGRVDAPAEQLRLGMNWGAHTPTARPDGKPIAMKPEFAAQHIEVIRMDEDRCIEWRFTYPDAPNSNAKLLRIELEPAAGGTQLRLSLAWELNPNRAQRPILRFLLRPLMRPWTRFMFWMHLTARQRHQPCPALRAGGMMKRIGELALGVVLMCVFVAWLIFRHQEPLSAWASSGTPIGWVVFGGAWLCCIGGAWLIATAWTTRPLSGEGSSPSAE